jgi:hypothetical protein
VSLCECYRQYSHHDFVDEVAASCNHSKIDVEGQLGDEGGYSVLYARLNLKSEGALATSAR